MENHGLISVDDYYSSDTSAGDRNMLTTRLRLDTTKINSANTLSFHFNGRERNVLAGKYYAANKRERIDAVNLVYEPGSVYLAVGRLYPKEVPVEHTDGVNFVYKKKEIGFGAFGGFKANPYTDEFSSKFMTAGAYLLYNRIGFITSSLAVIQDNYKGATDRQYAYGQLTLFPTDKLMLFGTGTSDFNQQMHKMNLTNAIVELNFRPDFSKNFALGYTYFKGFSYFKSAPSQLSTGIARSYYARANYRFFETYSLYGRVDRQVRNSTGVTGETTHSNSYQLGLTKDDILKSNVNVNGSVSINDSYGTAKHKTYSVELSRVNWEVLHTALNVSRTTNTYSVYNLSDKLWVFGGSANLYFKKRWTISLNYEYDKATSYTSSYLMSRVSMKF
ncbi:hypothetical protein EPN18_07910 [bacterium]|nr:MAG: hypothetical protein EPN18_07910 [bacterium]